MSCSAFAPLSFLISPPLHQQLSVSRVGYSCVCHLYLSLSPFYPQSVVFLIYMSTPIHTFLFASFLFPIGCICNLHVCSNTHLLPISHLCLAASSLFPEYDIPVSATYSFQIFSFQIVVVVVGGSRSTLRTAPGACGIPGWRPWGGPGVG